MGMFNRRSHDSRRERREAKGISRAELARRVGVTEEEIERLERGESTPSITKVSRIASALGVSVEELLTPPPNWPHNSPKP